MFLDRWLLTLSGAIGVPESTSVTINPVRSGVVTSVSFGGALHGGRCFGERWLVCPGVSLGVRGLSVVATGTLYRPGASLTALPTVGADLVVHFKVTETIWLSGFLRPFVPLGSRTALVEGTSVSVSTQPVEGWFGVGIRWVSGGFGD